MLPFHHTYLGSPKHKKIDKNKDRRNLQPWASTSKVNSKHNQLLARLTLPHPTYLTFN